MHLSSTDLVAAGLSGTECMPTTGFLRFPVIQKWLLTGIASFTLTSCQIMESEMPDRTILFLGDSFTEGYGLQPQESYPYQIQEKLQASGHDWKVVNGGMSGDTAMDAYYRLEPLLGQNPSTDTLVVFLGANDIFNGVDPDFTYNYLIRIIDRGRKHRGDMDIYVVRFPSLAVMNEDRARRFDAIFPRLQREKEIQLLPFFLEGVMHSPELCLPDGVHPNPEGMRRVAETVWVELFQTRLMAH